MSDDIRKLLDDFVGVIQREEREVMENSYDGISRKMRAALDERYNAAEKALLDAISALEARLSAAEQDARRLKAFRVAVIGWRENDWPEHFSRHTAELVAQLGQDAFDAALPEVKP